MNFGLLNERSVEQFVFVTMSTKYIRSIISTFGKVFAHGLFITGQWLGKSDEVADNNVLHCFRSATRLSRYQSMWVKEII